MIYSVSQLNHLIKLHNEQTTMFMNVEVTGEVSNVYDNFSKQHLYFKLKDANSIIKVSSFTRIVYKYHQGRKIKDGDRVTVNGSISFYLKDGSYSLNITSLKINGTGDFAELYKANYEKFKKLGYFAVENKLPIPKFVSRIGVITSLAGDVLHDIVRTIKRRNRLVEIYVFPCLVQGENSSESVIRTLKHADKYGVDVLIIARGGGSVEDLWSYNEEQLIESIIHIKTPIISAVGHETDWTLTDYAADLRASTPTAAAEIVSIPLDNLLQSLDNYKNKINLAVSQIEGYENKRLFEAKKQITYLLNNFSNINNSNLKELKSTIKTLSMAALADAKTKLNVYKSSILNNTKFWLNDKLSSFNLLTQKIDLINPNNILKKGFHLIYQDNKLVKDVGNVSHNIQIKSATTLVDATINKKS